MNDENQQDTIIPTPDFWDRDLDDIEADFLPDGKKITDMPLQYSVDGIPI